MPGPCLGPLEDCVDGPALAALLLQDGTLDSLLAELLEPLVEENDREMRILCILTRFSTQKRVYVEFGPKFLLHIMSDIVQYTEDEEGEDEVLGRCHGLVYLYGS